MRDHDSLLTLESAEMPSELLQPYLELGFVGGWELWIDDLGSLLAQAIGQPVLPVLGRSAVLPAVED
jgi:hypothetical protein